METERNNHESARDYTLRVLKYNIATMKMAPGSKINDQEIAAELGISRTPVREALMELAKYNLVEMYPQKGSVVAPVSLKMIQEATTTREVLECAAVQRCCHMEDTSVFDGLRENVELTRFYLSRGLKTKIYERDLEYHKILFSLSGMSMVHGFLRNLEIHYRRIVGLSFKDDSERRMLEDHQEILDAILAHDEAGAVSAMKKHLRLNEFTKEEIIKKYPDCVID